MKRHPAIGALYSIALGIALLSVSSGLLIQATQAQSSPPSAVSKPALKDEPPVDTKLRADSAAEVSFKEDILPVLVWRCGYCHMREDRHGSLIIDPELAYRSLVNVPAVSFASMMRVQPGMPEESFLIHKLTGEHARMGAPGRPMPTWPLSSEYMALLRQWISQGAKDN